MDSLFPPIKAICDGVQGREDSFGRKKREIEENEEFDNIEVREMFRVYESREEIESMARTGQKEQDVILANTASAKTNPDEVCLSHSGYRGLLVGLAALAATFSLTAIVAALCYRRLRKMQGKSTHFLDLAHSASILATMLQGKVSQSKTRPVLP